MDICRIRCYPGRADGDGGGGNGWWCGGGVVMGWWWWCWWWSGWGWFCVGDRYRCPEHADRGGGGDEEAGFLFVVRALRIVFYGDEKSALHY